MPLQLRIFAIFLGLFFLFYMTYLVRKNKAGVHQVIKWFVLGLLMLIGAVFFDFFKWFVTLLGFKTYSNFALFGLILVLLFFIFSLQLTVVKTEKQIITLTQEVSLLKAARRKMNEDKKDKKEEKQS